jgi:hypothetical protein
VPRRRKEAQRRNHLAHQSHRFWCYELLGSCSFVPVLEALRSLVWDPTTCSLFGARSLKEDLNKVICSRPPGPGPGVVSCVLCLAVLLPASTRRPRGERARMTRDGLRQDSMATPGNFGGGSTGPDQIFLGITGAPPSAPGRVGAQSPLRQNPNPQATKHERQTRAASHRGFLSAIHNRNTCRFLQATSDARKPAPHLVPGRSPPAGSVEGRSD